ncbi:hypothetical protein [Pulveribacter suum]|uniref:Uncharacterized protein n=1 Tax=Pulveribacter suum TaxID=2116657 RepID=A0A2P1NJZ8_9BURK|nr:hypothetical protein [Pulveribacter suum]AVP57356.1 hypothetical protein C7H73_06485 [Pulveribacter suum]
MQQFLQKNIARLGLALGAAVLATGCVAIPGDPYYDAGYSGGYGGPAYYPTTSAVTVYEQPGVIYTAPPPGWRAEAWREHQWRESRERDRQRELQRNERERRDWERQREAERRDMDRRRDAQQRDIERQREAQRREAERRREADREQAHRPPRDHRSGRSLEDALRDDAVRRQQWPR